MEKTSKRLSIWPQLGSRGIGAGKFRLPNGYNGVLLNKRPEWRYPERYKNKKGKEVAIN